MKAVNRQILTRATQYCSATIKLIRDAANGIRRASAVVTHGSVGKGLGGCRLSFWENDAHMVEDNLLLAGGMECKSLFHELPFTGGKVCVETVPGADLEVVFTLVAQRLVAAFEGRLLTTEDMGTDPSHMATMRRAAPGLILGAPIEEGGSGDPSPYTAVGVVAAIEATARVYLGRDLEGLQVYVQGVGHVGSRIEAALRNRGAHTLVSDVDPQRLAPLRGLEGVTIVDVDAVVEADIYCPCATGGSVGPEFAHRVSAVVGAANNQLTSDEVVRGLHARRVLYVPDWAVNGGGLISVAAEHLRESRDWAWSRSVEIGDRIAELLSASAKRATTALELAYEICESRSGRAA